MHKGTTRIVQYDRYLEAYFQDGSNLVWSNDTLSYFSVQGNRVNIRLKQASKSPEIYSKLLRIIQTQNNYGDTYTQVPIDEHQKIFKPFRIRQYQWQQSLVKSSQFAQYMITSDDLYATVTLQADLYIVRIEYLQLCTGKRVAPIKHQNRHHHYNIFVNYEDQPALNHECLYEYRKAKKLFTIFNLPEKWYPSIQKIWKYILVNGLISHEFSYIDFEELGLQSHYLATQMPQCQKLQDLLTQEEKESQIISFPKFGKPNHRRHFQWFESISHETSIFSVANQYASLLTDGFGFWSISQPNYVYKRLNKTNADHTYHFNALPIKTRFPNQPQRDIRIDLQAFRNYLNHNKSIPSVQQNSVQTSHSSHQLINTQNLQTGVFKAYANGLVVGRFIDKVFMTLQDGKVSIISASGQSFVVILGQQKTKGTPSYQYSEHLMIIQQFWQRTLWPEQWQEKMKLNDQVNEVIKSNEACRMICKMHKSGAL